VSAPDEISPSSPAGRRLVGVQFRRAAVMVYDFDAGAMELPHDVRVVVETERGEALGWTVGVPELRAPHFDEELVRRVLRVAQPHDLARDRQHHDKEQEALRFCAQRARQLGLPMKLIAAEWSHSADKAAFYFSSEERVDFRGLVRELAQRYRLRVEMRQIGPRDETKIIGAMGPCGRETCCSSWMRAFTPVSIKMAKDQGLALNPQKVTGVCGRLLCCLAYEQETYKELRKGLPRYGRTVITPRGTGRVVDVLTLRRRVRVSIEGEWLDFEADEVRPAGNAPVDESDSDGDETLETELDPRGSRGPHRRTGDRDGTDRRPRPDDARRRDPRAAAPVTAPSGPVSNAPTANAPASNAPASTASTSAPSATPATTPPAGGDARDARRRRRPRGGGSGEGGGSSGPARPR